MEYFITILTVLIAVIAVYIAWQQWKTNRDKLKLELFDKRFAIYKEVEKAIDLIVIENNPNDILNDLRIFYRSAFAEAGFLFGKEIQEYIRVIFDKGNKYWAYHRILEAPLSNKKSRNDDVDKALKILPEERKWFSEQKGLLAKKFKNYLNLSKL